MVGRFRVPEILKTMRNTKFNGWGGGGGMSVCGLWFTNLSHRVATTLRVAAGDTKLFLIAQPKKK